MKEQNRRKYLWARMRREKLAPVLVAVVEIPDHDISVWKQQKKRIAMMQRQ